MGKFKKGALIIYSIIVMIIILITYPAIYDVGKISDFIRPIVQSSFMYYLVSITFLLGFIVGIARIIYAIRNPNFKEFLIDREKGGSILLTKESIEENINTTLENFDKVKSSDIRVGLKDKKNPTIEVQIDCKVNKKDDLMNLGREIQNLVKMNLESFSGYRVSNIDVAFTEVKDSKGNAKDNLFKENSRLDSRNRDVEEIESSLELKELPLEKEIKDLDFVEVDDEKID